MQNTEGMKLAFPNEDVELKFFKQNVAERQQMHIDSHEFARLLPPHGKALLRTKMYLGSPGHVAILWKHCQPMEFLWKNNAATDQPDPCSIHIQYVNCENHDPPQLCFVNTKDLMSDLNLLWTSNRLLSTQDDSVLNENLVTRPLFGSHHIRKGGRWKRITVTSIGIGNDSNGKIHEKYLVENKLTSSDILTQSFEIQNPNPLEKESSVAQSADKKKDPTKIVPEEMKGFPYSKCVLDANHHNYFHCRIKRL